MISELGRYLQQAQDCGREELQADSAAPTPETGRRSHWGSRLVWLLCGLVFGALASGVTFTILTRPIPAPVPLMRFAVRLPSDTVLATSGNPFAFSHDGAFLVYAAKIRTGTQLFLRAMDQIEARPLPGTEGAYDPFFSPDGRWVGYFDSDDSKLKKVSLVDGKTVALCDAPFGLGATWAPDDTIIFTPDVFSGLRRIPAAGGNPVPLTSLSGREFSHRWPEVLPGGRTVLFTVGSAGAGMSRSVEALSLESGERRLVLDWANYPRYSPTGHLIFLRDDVLTAVPFDPETLEVRGSPVAVMKGIEIDKSVWAPRFQFSDIGSAVYVPASPDSDLRSLVWVDRKGGMEKLTVSSGVFSCPRLSPDGSRLAVTVYSEKGKADIWLVDVEHGSFTRLTEEGNNLLPVWTPDGTRVTFSSDRDGQWNIYWIASNGGAAPEALLKGEHPLMPNSWSPDGKILIFTEFNPVTGTDLWTLSLEGRRKTQPFLRTEKGEWGAVLSPDGRWLAYCSDEAGPDQVFIRRFEDSDEKWQISTAEGREPVWAPDGREIYYRYWRGLMGVALRTEPEFNPDAPRLLVSGRFDDAGIPTLRNYDIDKGSGRFVMVHSEREGAAEMTVELNWSEELKRRVR